VPEGAASNSGIKQKGVYLFNSNSCHAGRLPQSRRRFEPRRDQCARSVVHKTQVVKADPRTGKLVRSVVVSSKPVLTKIAPAKPAAERTSSELNAIVDKAARATTWTRC